MTEPINLNIWKAQREHVMDLAKAVGNDVAEPKALIVQAAKLQEMNAQVLDAVINDLGQLTQILADTQVQLNNVAGQTHLSISLFKEKDLYTAEEIHEVYLRLLEENKKMVMEEMKKRQEALEGAPDNVVQFPAAEDTTPEAG